MIRNLTRWAALTATLLAPTATYAQVSCTRAGLQAAADLYVAAQKSGDTSKMPFPTAGLGYWENHQVTPIADGIIKKPMKVDHVRSLIDTSTCQTFTEVIVTDKAAPYVLGTRMRINHGFIAEVETLWTTTGYWLFNADAYLQWSSTEKWDTIPAAQRDSRSTLEAAAGAYLDAFLEGKMDLVPWGFPCNRTEGGAHTGKGAADDTCQSGVPSGVNIGDRRFVVDETIGSVVVYCRFGVNGSPDTHLFRVENGKLRYVHTLTHLLQTNFQGNAKGKGKAAPPTGKQ